VYDVKRVYDFKRVYDVVHPLNVRPPSVNQSSIDCFNFLIERHKQLYKDSEIRLLAVGKVGRKMLCDVIRIARLACRRS
jgi:hypothetical protein